MTTAPAIDARPHATALKTAITATLNEWSAYDLDEVPGGKYTADEELRKQPLPPMYAVVHVERRYVPGLRSSGQASRSSWRVTVVAVGTTVDEARWVLDRADEALDSARLDVDGRRTSPLAFELSSSPEPDEGRFSARTQYTYTL